MDSEVKSIITFYSCVTPFSDYFNCQVSTSSNLMHILVWSASLNNHPVYTFQPNIVFSVRNYKVCVDIDSGPLTHTKHARMIIGTRLTITVMSLREREPAKIVSVHVQNITKRLSNTCGPQTFAIIISRPITPKQSVSLTQIVSFSCLGWPR